MVLAGAAMLKLLLFVALVANILLLVYASATKSKPAACGSNTSSGAASSSSASSSTASSSAASSSTATSSAASGSDSSSSAASGCSTSGSESSSGATSGSAASGSDSSSGAASGCSTSGSESSSGATSGSAASGSDSSSGAASGCSTSGSDSSSDATSGSAASGSDSSSGAASGCSTSGSDSSSGATSGSAASGSDSSSASSSSSSSSSGENQDCAENSGSTSSSSATSSAETTSSSSSNGQTEYCSEILIVCPQPNEVYDICPRTCPPQTCESLDRVYICPIVEPCDRVCESACVCRPGYYRNAIGECISEEQCRRCSGPNEYYSCGGACDNVCAYLSVQNQTCCPIINIKCNEMCYCKEGYARDDNGICVPFDQCPQPCDGCKGDPNAHRGCGINCGRHCSDLDNPDGVACVAMCYPDGCDCNDGYVLDDNIGLCVLPCDCTPTCGENEEFSTCTQGPDCFPDDCEPGCVCKLGYRRALDGTCVQIEDYC